MKKTIISITFGSFIVISSLMISNSHAAEGSFEGYKKGWYWYEVIPDEKEQPEDEAQQTAFSS